MKSQEIRDIFIQFFKDKSHEFASASSIAPEHDPTLLFTNAGMNQFKDVFLGKGSRGYSRAVNSQPCIRVSGKHNDLEDVGFDTTHQTLFEMLGNWSFGDYYKKEAISWAWELLTEVFKLPKEKLYATVYEDDDESFELWKTETDINPEHIFRFGNKDNFWEMGATGPCGPCSEIHIDVEPGPADLYSASDPIKGVNGQNFRYIELWNLVFIQYNRLEDGSLEDLAHKHVDTGAGLERLTAYMQNTPSNYMTDLFTPIIKTIETITHVPYHDTVEGMPHRVLADHIRTLVFAISEHTLPSNEGRGYVLRRLLRRALRYAKKLNYEKPILYQLVDSVVEVLGDHYSHLTEHKEFVKKVIKEEEKSFLATLSSGLILFEGVLDSLKNTQSKTISGADAFKLYDTYGFPIDLTQLLATEKQLTVDMDGFNSLLEKQREMSRQSTQEKLKKASQDSSESLTESDLKNLSSLPLHLSIYTDQARGGEARLISDPIEKVGMARHHSVTHILHQVLKEVLGTHVFQAGSFVDVDRLRFDFPHFSKLKTSEIDAIESKVNEYITSQSDVSVGFSTLEEAKSKGAAAQFGEKYDEKNVRVVTMGDFSVELCGGTHVQNTSQIESFKIIQESSIAAGTRRIEAIAGDQLIQSYNDKQKQGIIETISIKTKKLTAIQEEIHHLDLSYTVTKHPNLHSLTVEDLESYDTDLIDQIKKAEKQLSQMKNKKAGEDVSSYLEAIESIPNSDYAYLIKVVEDADIGVLRQLSDHIANQSKSKTAILLAATKSDKASVIVKLSSDFTTINAPKIIDIITEKAGGGGGGKSTMAQAGGVALEKLNDALESAKEHIISSCSDA